MNEEPLSMPQSKYAGYESGNDSDYDNVELKFTPFASVEATVNRTFGVDTPFGQSFAVALEDVELIDGGLYYDTDKQKYKLFSVSDAAGMSVEDAVERGMDVPTVDDFDEVITRTYFGNDKQYDLVAGRVEVPDDVDGETTSAKREVEVTDDGIETSDLEDHGGDPVPIPNTISWFNGTEDYGASAAAKSLVSTLTEQGGDLINGDGDDIYDWLGDVSGDDLTRDDLQDRRIELFLIRQESDEGRSYNTGVVLDTETGEQVYPNNRADTDGGGAGNASEPVRDATPAGEYPEPVADFIETASRLGDMSPDRAEGLLNELVADPNNALSEADIEDAGGKGVVIQEVTG